MNPALEKRWLALCGQAGLDGGVAWRELSDAYGNPARAYHNLHHLADCLLRFDEHVHLAADPVAVEFAIWFHDLVYDTHAADNEERSAAAAAEFLSSVAIGNTVAELIRATRHDGRPGSSDAALVCDIDLSILSRDPVAYDVYARAIRQEYGWVPLSEYVAGRTRVLEAFLARSSIFALDEMEKLYGEQARANLRREIRDLAKLVAD
jgi:predicted metal-dependent HD superfamily phosphohydrolase